MLTAVSDTITIRDWASIAGTIVAALIGVIGLVVTLVWQSRERERATFESALADVMRGLSARHIDLDAWLLETVDVGMRIPMRVHTPEAAGGPSDAPMQALVDAAYMLAPKADRPAMQALADTTFHLKRARISFQQLQLGRLIADIRLWRTGAVSRSKFIAAMQEVKRRTIAIETAMREAADATNSGKG
jgi:hypothetical protein